MSDSLVQPLLEQRLPKQFIYDLGLYLQTCAHIELAVCSVVLAIEGKLSTNPIKTKIFHELRKMRLKDLIKRLRSHGPSLEGEWHAYLLAISDWIDEYQSNRHIAVHGAFMQNADSGVINVLYTTVRKENRKPVYYPEETIITRDLAQELIADADRILRLVVSLGEKIERGEIIVRTS